jgi:anti-sigma regulatory factor (Ser/Thr protein kinase)
VTEDTASAASSVALPCDVLAPAAARRFARAFVGENEHSDVVELLVSELVTNVVVHTDSGVELELRQFDHHVRVEVSDRGTGSVEIREADGGPGGRGLRLVEAFAERWGVDARQPGKTVWFEVGAAN